MDGPRPKWWKRYELPVNLALAVFFLAVLVTGILLDNGVVAGTGLILLIFFSVYSMYGYVRRNW